MTNLNVNLRHLRAFSETAKSGTISVAAKSVHISQPAITQALNKLEQDLRCKLFIRSSNGMDLTKAGQLFQKRTTRLLKLIRKGAEKSIFEEKRLSNRAAPLFVHHITFRQIQALLALEEHLNFTHAAKTLNISQPSLHRLARDLELQADIRLFVTEARKVSLTKPAKIFATYARLAQSEYQQAIWELDELQGIEQTTIKFGALPLVRSALLPETINQFTAKYPSATISIYDGIYRELVENLRTGKIDFLIGALRSRNPKEGLVEEVLFNDSLGIYASKDHPLSHHENIEIRQLGLYPWIVPGKGTPTRIFFDHFFEESGLVPMQMIETGSLTLIRSLLDHGNRLTMISNNQMAGAKKTDQLRKLDIELKDPPRPIGITFRNNWHPTPLQKRFVKLLTQSSLIRSWV